MIHSKGKTERLDLIGNSAVTIRDYGTIVHKCKLVLELTQRGFPTNCPPRWLALYGYLQTIFPKEVGGGGQGEVDIPGGTN
jgi:hypothetical protein